MKAVGFRVLTSEVGDHRGEDEGEEGESQRHQLPAAVELTLLPRQEFVPEIGNEGIDQNSYQFVIWSTEKWFISDSFFDKNAHIW